MLEGRSARPAPVRRRNGTSRTGHARGCAILAEDIEFSRVFATLGRSWTPVRLAPFGRPRQGSQKTVPDWRAMSHFLSRRGAVLGLLGAGGFGLAQRAADARTQEKGLAEIAAEAGILF